MLGWLLYSFLLFTYPTFELFRRVFFLSSPIKCLAGEGPSISVAVNISLSYLADKSPGAGWEFALFAGHKSEQNIYALMNGASATQVETWCLPPHIFFDKRQKLRSTKQFEICSWMSEATLHELWITRTDVPGFRKQL